jgi:tetratricopeptide (TPR) repeat protein
MSRNVFHIALVGFLLAAPAYLEGQTTPAGFTIEDYADRVHDYLQGNYLKASRSLATIPREQVEIAADEYRERWLVDAQIKAAALLHAEILFYSYSLDTSFHIQMALKWIDKLDTNQRSSFERRWFFVMAYYYMRMLYSWETRPLLEAALAAFPDDVEFLLALGASSEAVGWMQEDARLLADAEIQYRRILELEPDHLEAHLRLGRVLKLQGRSKEAVPELAGCIDRCREPKLQLTGLLTLGDIHKEQGEFAEAIRYYRAAQAVNPEGQSAVIALGYALHRSGDVAGSFELIHGFFGQGAKGGRVGGPVRLERQDMWWQYILGGSDRFDPLLRELRSEIQP